MKPCRQLNGDNKGALTTTTVHIFILVDWFVRTANSENSDTIENVGKNYNYS